jgi:2-oxoglutarate ferredoxin oxidoreductase subunit alpha
MDQALSQNIATVEPFNLDGVSATPGKRVEAGEIEKRGVYKRYEFTEDNISAFAAPGTPGGMSLVTGNEHNEWGLVSTDPVNRVKMMNKRMDKIKAAKGELPAARHFGDKDAKIGFIGIGSLFGVILEAMEDLEREGVKTRYIQPRTIWPVLEDVHAFIDKCARVYVVELNAQAQLAHILIHQGADPGKIINILKYDGIPFRPTELVKRVLGEEGRMIKKGKKEAKLQ